MSQHLAAITLLVPAYETAGVRFLEQPREEEYGMVAVFEDPFRNRWDLLGLR